MTPQEIKEQITDRIGSDVCYEERININKLCEFLSTLSK